MMKLSVRRIAGLDLLRGLAVVLMFITHVWRLEDMAPGHDTQAWPMLESVFAFFLAIEPLTFALFLFVAGYSAALVRAPTRSVLKRCAKLAVLSSLTFFPEWGPQWPDLLIATGPLLSIAIAALLIHFALRTRRPTLVIAVGGAVVAGVTLAMELTGAQLAGFNEGSGGTTPALLFAALGAMVALSSGRPRAWLLAAFAVLGALAYALPGTITVDRFSRYWLFGTDYTAGAWFSSLITHAVPRIFKVRFWHYSLVGALRLALPLAGLTAAALAAGARVANTRVGGFFALFGRHALAVYIFHLVLIGVVHVTGLHPLQAASSLAYLVAVTAACFGLAAFLERYPRRRPSAVERLPEEPPKRAAA
jgi:uncharacterized membrane protein